MTTSSDLVFQAVTCPVCLELFTAPKLLPACGHSICSNCVKSILRKPQNATHSVENLKCPECRAVSKVVSEDANNDLKTNYSINRVIDAIKNKKNEAAEAEAVKVGEKCPHRLSIAKELLTHCEHCQTDFCQSCLANHIELLKLDMAFVSCGFRARTKVVMSSINSKVDSFKQQMDDNYAEVHEWISKSCDELIEKFANVVLDKKKQLIETARSKLNTAYKASVTSAKRSMPKHQSEIDSAWRSLRDVSAIHASIDDFVKLNALMELHDSKIQGCVELDKVLAAPIKLHFEIDYDAIIEAAKTALESASTLTMLHEDGNFVKTLESIMDSKKPPAEKNYTFYEHERMHNAAKAGDVEELKRIFSRSGLSVSCSRHAANHLDPTTGRSILHEAAAANSLEVVRYLVEDLKLDPRAVNATGENAVYFVSPINCDVIKYLLSHAPDLVETKDRKGYRLLHRYALSGNLDMVKFLVEEAGAEVDPVFMETRTPLLQAARMGHHEVVAYLLSKGADLQKTAYSENYTALHLACRAGHLKVAEAILNHSLELIDSRNKADFTPLIVAIQSDHDDIAELLIDSGANLELIAGDRGFAAIHHAVVKNNLKMIRLLLANQPDLISYRCEQGYMTPLHCAVSFGSQLETIKCLVDEYGASPTDIDDANLNALHMACQYSSLDVIKYFVEVRKCDLELMASGPFTNPLHHALESSNIDIIRYVLDSSPNLINIRGTECNIYPMQYARSLDLSQEIQQLLKERIALFRF